MKPLNQNLICLDLHQGIETSLTGFEVKSNKRFKKLKVVASSEDDIKVDDVVVVRTSVGEEDGDNIVINRRDIIYID